MDPDGYTLLANSSAQTIAPAFYPNLSYDPGRDLVAVASLGVSPFVLVVSPNRGFKTVGDLVAAAKAKPGAFNFSSPGVGSASHLSAERFRLSAGVQAQHVPFKGGVEAMTEVMAGRIDFFFMALGAALPQIRDGKAHKDSSTTCRSEALPRSAASTPQHAPPIHRVHELVQSFQEWRRSRIPQPARCRDRKGRSAPVAGA